MVEKISPLEIDAAARSYRYDADMFRAFERVLWAALNAYGDGYGHSVAEHLGRTSSALHRCYGFVGLAEELGRNVAHAFRLHDLGKTRQPPRLWNLPEKPTAEIKKERSNHVFLGAEVLDEALAQPAFAHLNNHPHLAVVECLMRHHHERIDGRGPVGLSADDLGQTLELATIIDTIDGKMLPRADRPARDASVVICEMTGMAEYTTDRKHEGQFRFAHLENVAAFYEKEYGAPILGKAG